MFSELADRLVPARQEGLAPRDPWLRQIMPKSLFGRSLLIVLLPLLILQAVLAFVFYERHWDTVTRWLAVGLAGEISLLVEMLETADRPAEQQQVLNLARRHFGVTVTLARDRSLADMNVSEPSWTSRLDQTLTKMFRRQLDEPFALDTTMSEQRPKQITIYVQLQDGLLEVWAPRKRVDSTTTRIFIGWMVGLSLLLLLLGDFLFDPSAATDPASGLGCR